MITREKLKEYMWCDGDIDGYSRSGRVKKNIISSEEWRFLDETLAKMTVIRNELGSKEFVAAHDAEKSEFDSEETYELFREFERKL